MRKKFLIFSIVLISIISLIALLNIEVSTRQGKDYKVSILKLPLYLKILNFYDRHLNYVWLVKTITGHLETKEEKVFRLFQWTHETILPQPKKLPVMDDHVWNIYIRGYGVSNNFNDLFSTLCNYINADAFFTTILNQDRSHSIDLTFVKTERGWVVFDPHNGVYFNNNLGKWATTTEIKKQNWKTMHIGETAVPNSYYKPYLAKLPNIENIGLGRAHTQSPVNRLKYQLIQWFYRQSPLLE